MRRVRISAFLVSGIILSSFINAQRPDKIAASSSQTASGCPSPTARIFSNLSTVKAGTEVAFEVQSGDGEKIQAEFIWTNSKGTIVSGQGTSRIMVLTPEDALAEVRALSTSTPNDPNGFIWSWPRRPTVPLKISAVSVSRAGCSDLLLTTEISIGTRSVAENFPANVTELILDTAKLESLCTSELPIVKNSFSPLSVVSVSTKAVDPENDVITYTYTVTAGKIVGKGANVKWDLSTVAPGTYEITAGVDDGCGNCGKTVSKSVTILRCD